MKIIGKKSNQNNGGSAYENRAFMLKGADLARQAKESTGPGAVKPGGVKQSPDRPVVKLSTDRPGAVKPSTAKESGIYLSPTQPVRIKPGFLSEMSKPKGK